MSSGLFRVEKLDPETKRAVITEENVEVILKRYILHPKYRGKINWVLTHSPNHLLAHSPNHLLTHSPKHLLTHSPIIYSLTHLTTYLLTHLTIYSLTHLGFLCGPADPLLHHRNPCADRFQHPFPRPHAMVGSRYSLDYSLTYSLT
jgi:hypothetical protein